MGAMNCKSNCRVAVMVPSAVAVYPVAVVPSVTSDAGAFGSLNGWTPLAIWAVTVAATSVCNNSQRMGVAAADPSKEMDHALMVSGRVAGVAICSIVLMAEPVVTGENAATVGMGPLPAQYRSGTLVYPITDSKIVGRPLGQRVFIRLGRGRRSR